MQVPFPHLLRRTHVIYEPRRGGNVVASNPLVEVKALGQSIWFDYIQRQLLLSGEVARMITEDGIAGARPRPSPSWIPLSAALHYVGGGGDERLLVRRGWKGRQ